MKKIQLLSNSVSFFNEICHTFKTFVSTLTSDAKENLDLKCKLYSLRLISGWLETFSITLREGNRFKDAIENESKFIEEIEECLKISSTDEFMFEESLVVFKSVIKHRPLFFIEKIVK